MTCKTAGAYALAWILMLTCVATAQVPSLLNYQGRLTNSAGVPLDTIVDLTFEVFADEAAVSAMWSEAHSGVSIIDGLFSLILGGSAAFPDTLWSGSVRFIGVTVGGGPRLDPLTPIVSVAYAVRSGSAGSSDEAAFAAVAGVAQDVAADVIDSHQIVDSSISFEDIGRNAAGEGQVMKWNGSAWVAADDNTTGSFTLPYSGNAAAAGPAFFVTNTGVSGGPGIRGESEANDGAVGFTAASDKSGVYGYSTSGIGVTGRCEGENDGVHGEANSSTVEHAGVFGVNLGSGPGVAAFGSGVALHAESPVGYAGQFEGHVGILGRQKTTAQSGTAGYFTTGAVLTGDTGVVYADYNGGPHPTKDLLHAAIIGRSHTADTTGVGGWFDGDLTGIRCDASGSKAGYFNEGLNATAFNSPGGNIAATAYAYSSDSSAQAIQNVGMFSVANNGKLNYGVLTRAGDEHFSPHQALYAYGVDARASGVDSVCWGVRAVAYNADTTFGIWTEASGGTTANYGIYAAAPAGGNDWAGCFIGDVLVTGILYGGTKEVRIDHPLDPENKYLTHAAVESPEMLTVYSGKVVLDDYGEAVVQLPGYFAALNDDCRYKLTPIGAPMPNLYVAEEVSGTTFRVAGGAPRMKVSWEVSGVRIDPYAMAHPIEAEIDKPRSERGRYLHPEAYGLDRARGLHTGERRDTPEPVSRALSGLNAETGL
ncbi:MAG: hypothetical protein KKA42_08245 [candidate division Zixibacteria bacterium]|nr:hypothetical protein [candidate division Zixibacteria bacterium]